MQEEEGIHLITAEQARRFFVRMTGSLGSDIPIEMGNLENGQSDVVECNLIIGSTIVSFLGTSEARFALEKLVKNSSIRNRTPSNLFFG
jgi:hypothetical protein